MTTFKAGDIVEFQARSSGAATRVKLTGEPRVSHGYLRVPGYRWIKSTKKFSGNALLWMVDIDAILKRIEQ